MSVLNHEKLRIRFDGPAMADHRIDVAILGQTLTGLGEVLQHANHAVNGDAVHAKVQMDADVQANCITMDFVVLQGW